MLTRGLLPLALVPAVAACGHKGSARLEGHWRGVRAEGVSSEVQAAADAFATSTELDVRADTILITTPKGKQSGKFKVKSEEKGTLTIWTDGDGPNDPQSFVFVDDRTMKWNVLEGRTITFRKDGDK